MVQSKVLGVNTADLDLNTLNQKFQHAHPRRILTWCMHNISGNLVQVSNFNIDDVVITDLIYRAIKPAIKVPVVFVDSLHNFSETLELVTKATIIYDLDLRVFRIRGINSRTDFAHKYGDKLWERDIELFEQLTKIEPLEQGLKQFEPVVQISGRCRSQGIGADYQLNPVFELDEHKRLKINPFASWSRVESWAYVYEYDVVYNPLYDIGYGSVGDEPLTQKSDCRC